MEDLKHIARDIFAHALDDCSIPHAMDRTLRMESSVQGQQLYIGNEPPIALDRLKHLRIAALGKAAAVMLEALLAQLAPLPSCDLAGVLVAPRRPANLPPWIEFFAGGHPLPNAESLAAASAALGTLHEIANSPPDEALALFLISGGASAMMELPLDPDISLADTIAFHQALVHSGANIVEINCVRKHFSAVKGGRLALAAGSARKLSLLVSDVPPAHLDALASGPTLPDSTTIADCREILARYSLLDRFPASIRRYFESPSLPETPKPGAFLAPVITLLDSSALAAAAQSHAAALGFHAAIDNTCDDWSCDRAADYLLARLRDLRRTHPRYCLISTGEVSVSVPEFDDSASHLGGRNQHLALYLATQLRAEDAGIAILSAGSDGIDGNSIAAGAVIDERTIDGSSSVSRRDSALRALAAFDSFPWLAAHDAAIVTGPTGQNLRDLRILLADAV
ncbi:MAG TPA: DUF4147 domain-containing protein [Acidobacteriaceae bacterium]|nr:DUF4147 domain-containing protein [Acidobacteriaceae bacterium]